MSYCGFLFLLQQSTGILLFFALWVSLTSLIRKELWKKDTALLLVTHIALALSGWLTWSVGIWLKNPQLYSNFGVNWEHFQQQGAHLLPALANFLVPVTALPSSLQSIGALLVFSVLFFFLYKRDWTSGILLFFTVPLLFVILHYFLSAGYSYIYEGHEHRIVASVFPFLYLGVGLMIEQLGIKKLKILSLTWLLYPLAVTVHYVLKWKGIV